MGDRERAGMVHEGKVLSLFERNFGKGGRRGEAIRAMGCFLHGHPLHTCRGPIVAAHARSRGTAGGNGNSDDLFNACQGAYEKFGEYGTSVRAQAALEYNASPVLQAVANKAKFDEKLGPEGLVEQ